MQIAVGDISKGFDRGVKVTPGEIIEPTDQAHPPARNRAHVSYQPIGNFSHPFH
jgi:hypothetical protein